MGDGAELSVKIERHMMVCAEWTLIEVSSQVAPQDFKSCPGSSGQDFFV